MKNKGLFIIILTISLGCSSNTSQISNGRDSIAINANISMPTLQTQIDTINSIKGHCFLLENTIGNGQNQKQYRRLLNISNDLKKCTYKIFNSNTNLIRSDRELDVRTDGELKIKKDTLYVNWIGYYNSYQRHENDQYRKLNRVIEGKYAIEIIENKIMLKFISEKIITEELDEDSSSDNELPYNESLENLYYKPIECENAEKIYFVENFTPQKNNHDLELDKFSSKYNKEHSCNDQRSFDAGYDLARDQIGNGLIADADYLFKLTSNQYNYYCFKKGVSQWLKDNNRSY